MTNSKKDFIAYMSAVTARLQNVERLGTAHVYRSTLNRINEFVGGRPLPFEAITPTWLQAFQNYLLGRMLNWNTISTYMRMLRAVYYRAVDEGLAPFRPRLFKGVYTGTRVTVKRALDEQILRRLQKPVSASESLERSRLLFVLLFMLRGIPFVDIAYMRRCDLHGNLLTYRRRKTGAWLTVRVEPEAMKLIERLKSRDPESPYLFPFVRGTGAEGYRQYTVALRRFNYRLKQLATTLKAGIQLSSYAARHSWATLANYRDFQPELISNAMGHSSVKITETYFKRHSDERIHDMNRSILSYLSI